MKVLPFTMLVPKDRSVISEVVEHPHFYQYLHRHIEWQITWVQQGSGTFIAGSNMYPFAAGDIFLIGPNLPHLFKSNPEYFQKDSKLTIKACSLYFNPSGALGALFNLPEMLTAKSFLLQHKHGFKIPFLDQREISALMLKLAGSSGKELLHNMMAFLDVLQNLKGSIQPLCSAMYTTDISETEGRKLSDTLSFIMANYNNQITLEDAANVANMTPQAFCRYFKKHTGHTFVSFLNEVRINDACKSLLYGNSADCISGAAYKAGFNSITNFNRVFKNIIGKSPRLYVETYHNISRNAAVAV
ncbi:MAG: helix-turn-helix domain-containing protein [Chitinophagaceae bacterium]|nr:MAG: helix-turn-helix domain-containing protein [Chitinophagaceae bacterium]